MTTGENNTSICLTGLKNRRLAPITDEEREAAQIAYREHKRLCHQMAIAAQPYDQWLSEWLECRRLGWVEGGLSACDQESRESRDYERMFEGKRGFEQF
jgi:hypothetical protein